MDKKRVSYYDLAKGFGIILVVLGHIEYIGAELRGWISSFHMPLFFVVSGMLIAMKREESVPMDKLVKKKLRGIMLPYYWFALVYLPIDIFNIVRGNIDMHTFWQDQIYSINGYGISVMWFLPALFIGEICALALIKKVMSTSCTMARYTALLAAALAASVILYYIFQPIDRIFLENEQSYIYAAVFGFIKVVFRGCILSVFIVIGYIFERIIAYFDISRSKSLIIGIILFTANIFMSLYNGSIDTHYLILKNLPMFYLCACTGSFAVILISRGIGSIRFIEYFGRNSLIIMATHIQLFILYISLLIAFKLDQYTVFLKHHIFIFCTVVCVMLIEIPVIEVINRFFPFMVGRKRS